jgi:hypothetical protein
MINLLITRKINCPKENGEIDQVKCWVCPNYVGLIGKKVRFVRCNFK